MERGHHGNAAGLGEAAPQLADRGFCPEQGLGGGSDGSLRGNGFAQQQDDGQGAGGQGASARGTDGEGLGELEGAAAAATASYVSDESINVWM